MRFGVPFIILNCILCDVHLYFLGCDLIGYNNSKAIQMSHYLVPTADKSLSSVRSTVLATGVSLFFMYLVRLR